MCLNNVCLDNILASLQPYSLPYNHTRFRRYTTILASLQPYSLTSLYNHPRFLTTILASVVIQPYSLPSLYNHTRFRRYTTILASFLTTILASVVVQPYSLPSSYNHTRVVAQPCSRRYKTMLAAFLETTVYNGLSAYRLRARARGTERQGGRDGMGAASDREGGKEYNII